MLQTYAWLASTGWVAVVVVAAAGACLGSFLNVVIYRLPRSLSVWPGSACPRCRRPLRWRELVPVVSYAWLRGRCSACGCAISPAYPLVEAGMGGLTVGLMAAFGWSMDFVRYLGLAFLLVAAAEIDRRHGIIPNRLLAVGAAGGAVLALSPGGPGMGPVLVASLGSGGVLLLLRAASRWLTGRAGMGMGDVKLAATTALYLGWESLWVFYLAAVLGAALGLAGLCTGRLQRTSRLPFAPFVAVGALLDLFALPPSMVLALW